MVTPDTRPLRGTRPSNRRELILEAATDLFARKGYSAVSMGEIADEVAIGPSALYRHFRNKDQLLAAVIDTATSQVEASVTGLPGTSFDDLACDIARDALIHRNTGLLWRREVRHLEPAERAAQSERAQVVSGALAARIREHRPDLQAEDADLLGRAALAVAHSVSFHRLTLDGETLLTELVRTALSADIVDDTVTRHEPSGLRTNSRREEILERSVELFSRRGYAQVGTEDIGAAVGIAGPSLYKHFSSKADILATALFRGDEWLQQGLTQALSQATDARDGLSRLVASYVEFVMSHPHLVHILVTEAHHLPEAEGRRGRAAQRAYISEWVHLARQVHPEWDATSARVRVQAAQILVNEIAIDSALRARPSTAPTLIAIASDLLEVPGTLPASVR